MTLKTHLFYKSTMTNAKILCFLIRLTTTNAMCSKHKKPLVQTRRNSIDIYIGTLPVKTTDKPLMVIGCIPLLGIWGIFGLATSVRPQEKDEGLLRKGGNTEEGTNPTPFVASNQERSKEENMIF